MYYLHARKNRHLEL